MSERQLLARPLRTRSRLRKVTLLVPESCAEGLRQFARELRNRHPTQTEPAIEAPEWRTLSPSAELLVDPERRARCAVRDTQAPGAHRYLWSVTLLGHFRTIAAGRTGKRDEARQLAEAALATYAVDLREVPGRQDDVGKPGTSVPRCADRPSIHADNFQPG